MTKAVALTKNVPEIFVNKMKTKNNFTFTSQNNTFAP